MRRRVILHGDLGARFGREHSFGADTALHVGSALKQIKGFPEYVNGKQFSVLVGDDNRGFSLGAEDLAMNLGSRERCLHIVPVVAGEKKAGAAKVVLGIALIAGAVLTAGVLAEAYAAEAVAAGAVSATTGSTAATLSIGAFSIAGFTVSYANIALFGLSMALSGMASLLAPSPKAQNFQAAERPDQRPSFLFNGAVNVTVQGGPVPVVYGMPFTGSVTVSSGIAVEQLNA